MLVYKFDLRTCVRIIQTMSIFSATGNNFLENLSGSLIRILCRFARENPQVPRILIEYLVGKHDFYKIMKYDTYTQIQGYNCMERWEDRPKASSRNTKFKCYVFPQR